jgi:Zn ribbon nucleic-acid-binding protein
MNLTVTRHIAGARCVIYRNPEHYIDVRKDARTPRYETAECVRQGRVYRRQPIDLAQDPAAQVLQLIREELV